MVVPEDVPADRVRAELAAAGGDLLEDARLFDVYRGESVPAGAKSLAYALTYRDSSLEVRRRYRKLICLLTRRDQAICDKTGDGIRVACRARRQRA